MNDQPIQPGEGILHHAEGVDLIPANIELAGMEVALVNSMNREKMLKQELYQSGKESLYYGLNALSNNLIMVDRKKLKNPNGLILGTPGSGKSFSAKREIANAFLVTDDDIIINDPEGEYSPLVNRLKGQVIKISPNSTQFINPMDINANYSEEDNPLSLKADFILSLCELVVGGKEGLLPVEKTVIDRCVHLIYRKYFADPCPENMPILEDLYNALLQQDEKEAHHVATALEIYVKGSLNLFNHRTNVNVNNRIVCYDIKELGKHKQQQAAAQIEVEKPFPQEEELAEKSARLAELNAQLDMDEKSHEPEQDEEPRRSSVLAALEEKSDKVEPIKPFKSYLDKDGDAR